MLDRMIEWWSQIFGRPVAADDDFFFDLEGDSLKALELIELMSAELAFSVPIRRLFDEPTPRLLAQAVTSLGVGDDGN